MKEFLKNKTITYNLMSFTGFKALIFFSLLMESPKSYKEICEYFVNHPYLKEAISIDTLRVYINSLRRAGCTVKRIRIDGESKYVIVSHPFELHVTSDQINSIVKVYKSIVKNISVNELITLDKFFGNVINYVENDEFKDAISKVSPLNGINEKLLDELIDCCVKKEQIVIRYNSPNSGTKDIELVADQIEFNNNKLYLYGTGFEYMQYGSFLISRIIEIKEIKLHKTIPANIPEITVGFELNNEIDELELDDCEKIIKREEDKIIVEMTSSNEFLMRQKLLSYGSGCKILYPEHFKTDFITHLSNMKAGYFID